MSNLQLYEKFIVLADIIEENGRNNLACHDNLAEPYCPEGEPTEAEIKAWKKAARERFLVQ
eukprot:4709874-Ditylum_brightwellii.AAC.1